MIWVIVILVGAWWATMVLLAIACGGNANLAKENRRLRRALARATHPSARLAPGRNPIFDSTLAEIMALDETPSGGAA